MNPIEIFNRSLFLQINGGNDTPAWLIQFAIFIADDLIYLIPVLLLCMWLRSHSNQRSLAMKACLVTLLALGINQAIGQVWPHPRPFMLGLGHTWLPHSPESSFPSDHMTVFAGVGLTLLLDGALWLGLLTLVTGLSVAWARVFVGVHFPLDMLGAVGVAGCSYFIASPFWHRVGMAITGMVERLYRAVLARPISAGWIQR